MLSIAYPPVTEALLTRLVQKIVETFHPEQVILFGSYAWGVSRPDSDIDLLVIMEHDLRPAQCSAEISLVCRPQGIAVDFLVKTPAEVHHRLRIGDPFLRRVLEKGRVLYAR